MKKETKMKKIKKISYYLIFFIVIFGMIACDDNVIEMEGNELVPTGETPTPENPTPQNPTPENPNPGPTETPVVTPEQPAREYTMLLIALPPTEVTMNVVGSVTLSVLLYSIDSAEPAVNEKIKWEITKGAEFVRAESNTTRTNDIGQASLVFEATGMVGDVEVTVSHPSSKTAKYTIHVVPLPTGDIKATASYTGKAPVVNYSVVLYDNKELRCDGISPDWRPDDVRPLDTIDEKVALFEDLLLDQSFTLVAYGYSELGALVAYGCNDSHIVTEEDKVISYAVKMDTIPLNPVTTYHVRSYFDFGDIISKFGTAGEWISKIVTEMDNPGGLMYDVLVEDLLLTTACSQVLPGLVCKGVSWLMDTFNLDDKLSNYLNSLITSSETGCKVIDFVCQMRSIVQTFELLGTLSVESSGGDVNFMGTNSYSGMAFYWRTGCVSDFNNPNYDPNCGRTAIEDKALNSLGVISGIWNGTVTNYDELTIRHHDLEMNYGKIIHFIIMNYLLPKIAGGATNFTDALAYWFKCDSVANWAENNIKLPNWLGGAGVSYADGYKWCTKAAALIDGLLNFSSMLLQIQKTNSDLGISGFVHMTDSSGDNVIDVLEDGVWDGSISVEGKASVVEGLWSAYNRENDGYCTYEKTSTDASTQLCAFPKIDITSIIHSGVCGTCSAQ